MNIIQIITGIFSYQKNSPLLFTGSEFWIFLLVALGGLSFLYKKNTTRHGFLLVMNLFFYYKSGGAFLLILLGTVTLNYFLILYLAKLEGVPRKILFWFILVLNLGSLAWFKYFFQARDFLDLMVPLGISFYTFQNLSYLFEVHRKKVKPVSHPVDYFFYCTFFPQIVSGPIVRANDFIPQLYEEFHLSKEEFGNAVFLILAGLVKKLIISDYVALNFVDRVFDNPAAFSGVENLLAAYGYSIQIFCDFSGYTDIAIGVALLLGYRLPVNFNFPYKANDMVDFWNRWHMSLSKWLRDYVFLPTAYALSKRLKNDRYLHLKTDLILYSAATMTTMIICGVWHGSTWKFVWWGGIHGLAMIAARIWKGFRKGKKGKGKSFRHFLSVFLTFQFITFTWIIFRARDMQVVSTIFDQIANHFNGNLFIPVITGYYLVFLLMAVAFILHWLPSKYTLVLKEKFIIMPNLLKLGLTIVTILVIYQFKSAALQPFIYFQF